MPSLQSVRVTRELSLATFGANVAQVASRVEPWVTNRLVSIAEEGHASAHEVIFSLADPPDSFYFARQGRVLLAGRAGGSHEVACPSLFGMADVVLDRPRSQSATALSDVEFYRVRADRWFDLLEDSFPLARASVMAMVHAVAAVEEKAWADGAPAVRPSVSHAPCGSASPMSIVERLGVLMDTPLLRGAGVQVLSDLASMSEEASFGAGEALFDRGRRPDRFFILATGEVEASREDPRVVWRGGPGQIVCDVAWLADDGPRWQARAVTPARALVFRVEDWSDLMEENFEMVRPTLAALVTQREGILGLT